ncbi:MAG: 3-hydroxyacyl-ACP dehydratase FabZ [Spirochaetaceae bacterium]|nr:3-hydroxyacyl-ACP dehydratase FabZ [Spirochaetaceae bacterium]
MLNAKEIQEIIRQGYPFILIDRITELKFGESVTALKNVSMGESCFLGHFPDDPIFPGVLIIEGMAQAGGFLFYKEGKKQTGVIAAVDKVKFLKEVVPGDTIYYKGIFLQKIGNFAKVSFTAEVENKIVAKGEISYSFAE